MKINVKTLFKSKMPEVRKQLEKRKFRMLQHAAAAIRLTAVRSIRKGGTRKKEPSPPGSPPKTWGSRQYLKRELRFSDPEPEQGRTKVSVFVRPVKSGNTVFKMHEYGGRQPVEFKEPTEAYSAFLNRKRRGPFGYDPRSESRWSRKKKEQGLPAIPDKQMKYIRMYYSCWKSKAARLKMVKVVESAEYPARPFLGPAVEKNRERIPSMWTTSR